MSGNSFGKLFCVTSFGESHGPALGCIVDGCPPGLALTEADIQLDLDRRKPGTSRFTTQRREDDAVRILSGVFTNFAGGNGMPGAGPQTLNSLVCRRSGMEPSWKTLPKPAVK